MPKSHINHVLAIKSNKMGTKWMYTKSPTIQLSLHASMHTPKFKSIVVRLTLFFCFFFYNIVRLTIELDICETWGQLVLSNPTVNVTLIGLKIHIS